MDECDAKAGTDALLENVAEYVMLGDDKRESLNSRVEGKKRFSSVTPKKSEQNGNDRCSARPGGCDGGS
jgi:hypothetical protein